MSTQQLERAIIAIDQALNDYDHNYVKASDEQVEELALARTALELIEGESSNDSPVRTSLQVVEEKAKLMKQKDKLQALLRQKGKLRR